MIVPLFGFIHGIGLLVFMMVIMAFMKQLAQYCFAGLQMLYDEFEDRQNDRYHQQLQREKALEHLQRIRQNYERR